ncbi:hypothetical protein BBP40_009503 [Aspergillus hancockii]|nr:hypothetical protein BBP40_009503 [Aspergillus hancockii]
MDIISVGGSACGGAVVASDRELVAFDVPSSGYFISGMPDPFNTFALRSVRFGIHPHRALCQVGRHPRRKIHELDGR